MKAFQGLWTEFREAVEDSVEGLFLHISGFGEELVGEANQFFLGSEGKKVPWREREILPQDLLAVQSGASMPFADSRQWLQGGQATILPSVFSEHLRAQEAVPEIVFCSLAKNGGRMALPHADVVKESAGLHKGGIQRKSTVLQQLQGFLTHLFAVAFEKSSQRGVFGIEDTKKFLGVQWLHVVTTAYKKVCGSNASLGLSSRETRSRKGTLCDI